MSGPPLHVLEAGRGGTALVLLHLFAGSALCWEPIVERLAGRHRCIVPDLRGFGASPPPAAGAALADWADDLAALTAPLERHVLVGHSMGGKIATLLASRRPAGLAALVLVAPSPPTPEPIPDRAAMLGGLGDPAAAVATAHRISARAGERPVLERLVGDSLRTSRLAWEWWVERGSREDISEQAARIAVPVHVVAGAEDKTIPPALLEREVVGRIPVAAMTTVPDSRHAIPLDAPDALAALIEGWAG